MVLYSPQLDLARHVFRHYIARDEFRLAMLEYTARTKNRMMNYLESPTFMSRHEGDDRWEMDHRAAVLEWQLQQTKHETLQHLHMLLHRDHSDRVLDKDKHHHIDMDEIRFIIEELW